MSKKGHFMHHKRSLHIINYWLLLLRTSIQTYGISGCFLHKNKYFYSKIFLAKYSVCIPFIKTWLTNNDIFSPSHGMERLKIRLKLGWNVRKCYKFPHKTYMGQFNYLPTFSCIETSSKTYENTFSLCILESFSLEITVSWYSNSNATT